MPRSAVLLSVFACARLNVIAFVPSRTSLLLSFPSPTHILSSTADATSSSLSMIPPSPLAELSNQISINPSQVIPSFLTAYDDSVPEYQAKNAFEDQVTFSDLISDPIMQGAFALTGVAIVALFIAKSIVTQMDDAVQKTAMDFDRVMKNKYPKKWKDFMEEEEEITGVIGREEREADRIQRIVEEMERLTKEEPDFFEKAMRDVERQI